MSVATNSHLPPWHPTDSIWQNWSRNTSWLWPLKDIGDSMGKDERQVERTAFPKTQEAGSCVGEEPSRENEVVKVKTGWHWLAEEGKMPFTDCLLWEAKGLAYVILLKFYNHLSRWVLSSPFYRCRNRFWEGQGLALQLVKGTVGMWAEFRLLIKPVVFAPM